jgi:predicted TIM-barrel fold metal-dependent hydrolase
MTPPLVDAHFHVYEQSMPLADGAWHHPCEDASVERALATLDAHGIPLGVISAASIYGTYNDYVRAALRRHRRLRATLMPDLDWDIHTLEAYRDDGFTGVRFLWRPLAEVPDIGSEPYRRLLRRCADLGWHVHLTDRPERIDGTIRAIEASGAAVVLDHLALIDTDLGVDDPGFRAVLDAIDRGRTWVKLSGGFRFKRPGLADAAARALVSAGGWERLMWASDWPFAGFEATMSYETALGSLADWVPDPEMRAAVAGGTALRFYFA